MPTSADVREQQAVRNLARFGSTSYPGGHRGEWPDFPDDTTVVIVHPSIADDGPDDATIAELLAEVDELDAGEYVEPIYEEF